VRGGAPGVASAFLIARRTYARVVSTVTIGEFAVGADRAESRLEFSSVRWLALGRELAIYAGCLQARFPFEMGDNSVPSHRRLLHRPRQSAVPSRSDGGHKNRTSVILFSVWIIEQQRIEREFARPERQHDERRQEKQKRPRAR